GSVLDKLQALGEGSVVQDDCAAHAVRMSVQVFCRAVNDDVCSQLKGTLEIGTHERIVNGQRSAALVGQRGDGGNIGDFHDRIGGGLDEDQARVRAQRALHLLQPAGVRVAEAESEIFEYPIELQ